MFDEKIPVNQKGHYVYKLKYVQSKSLGFLAYLSLLAILCYTMFLSYSHILLPIALPEQTRHWTLFTWDDYENMLYTFIFHQCST